MLSDIAGAPRQRQAELTFDEALEAVVQRKIPVFLLYGREDSWSGGRCLGNEVISWLYEGYIGGKENGNHYSTLGLG